MAESKSVSSSVTQLGKQAAKELQSLSRFANSTKKTLDQFVKSIDKGLKGFPSYAGAFVTSGYPTLINLETDSRDNWVIKLDFDIIIYWSDDFDVREFERKMDFTNSDSYFAKRKGPVIAVTDINGKRHEGAKRAKFYTSINYSTIERIPGV